MRPLYHPSVEDITVEAILHALSDPVRVAIFAQIEEKTRNGILCTPSVNPPRKQRMSFRQRSVTHVKSFLRAFTREKRSPTCFKFRFVSSPHTDHDGNIHGYSNSGERSTYDSGGWRRNTASSSSWGDRFGGMDRESWGRSLGAQRFDAFRRGGWGGFRGGGRFRR